MLLESCSMSHTQPLCISFIVTVQLFYCFIVCKWRHLHYSVIVAHSSHLIWGYKFLVSCHLTHQCVEVKTTFNTIATARVLVHSRMLSLPLCHLMSLWPIWRAVVLAIYCLLHRHSLLSIGLFVYIDPHTHSHTYHHNQSNQVYRRIMKRQLVRKITMIQSMQWMHLTTRVPYWFVLLLLTLVSLPLRECIASDLDSGRDEFGDDIRPIGEYSSISLSLRNDMCVHMCPSIHTAERYLFYIIRFSCD